MGSHAGECKGSGHQTSSPSGYCRHSTGQGLSTEHYRMKVAKESAQGVIDMIDGGDHSELDTFRRFAVKLNNQLESLAVASSGQSRDNVYAITPSWGEKYTITGV